MYIIRTTKTFDSDVKRCKKRGYDMEALRVVMQLLETTGTLPAEYKAHKLLGNFKGHWECHIKPDWLLIWRQNNDELVLLFTNSGTHSDLFKK